MSHARRVQEQPAYLLHHRPFRDSSLLIDLLSRDHGRLAVVARGARAARSRLKGVLRPFLPLRLSWVARGDLGTLTGAELDGAPLALTGDGLLSGYYVNELLLNLLHRHDPQPEVFAAYRDTIGLLAASAAPAVPLRRFELELLALLGYAPTLEHEARSSRMLCAEAQYEYRIDEGAVPVSGRSGPMVFAGRELIDIREQRFDDEAALAAAGRLLRAMIAFHLGGKELRSRRVMVDLKRSRVRMADRPTMETEEDT